MTRDAESAVVGGGTGDVPARTGCGQPRLAASDLDVLVDRAAALAVPGGRRLLGLCGSPASGKSTLAVRLVDALGPARAVVVGMDGFHLAQAVLDRHGSAARKGAPDTFDAAGYVALLRRLREPEAATVYAPEFRREIEEPIAGAVAVAPDVPLVVTEGNYLLMTEPPWGQVRALLDEVWFLDPGERLRLDRLVARHRAYGRTPAEARARAHGSDQANARAIAATADRADLLVG